MAIKSLKTIDSTGGLLPRSVNDNIYEIVNGLNVSIRGFVFSVGGNVCVMGGIGVCVVRCRGVPELDRL